MKSLIKHGADVHKTLGASKNKASPLMMACYRGNLEIVKFLHKHNALIEQRGILFLFVCLVFVLFLFCFCSCFVFCLAYAFLPRRNIFVSSAEILFPFYLRCACVCVHARACMRAYVCTHVHVSMHANVYVCV